MEYLHILGRILFGGYFIFNGFNNLANSKMMVGYAQSKKVPMASVGVPIAGVILFAGGLSFVFDFHALAGSLLLIIFIVPATFMIHNFWKIQDSTQKMAEMVNFTKNLALLGALILFAVLRHTKGVSL